MDVGDDDAVKAVFSRCLPVLRDLDLWRSYLRYMMLTNEDRGGPGIEDIRKAYDFSLQYIGEQAANQDSSGEIQGLDPWTEVAGHLAKSRIGLLA